MLLKLQIFCILVLAINLSKSLVIRKSQDDAKMARYVMRTVDWVSIATTSTAKQSLGYSVANLKSTSDGPPNNSTGVPYFYLSDLDFTGKDLNVNNNCSLMASLAQTDYCKIRGMDPQSPLCVRVLMTGKIVKINANTAEYNFAKNALFTRHPQMKYWPPDHDFYLAKMNIEYIGLLDAFGGIKHVSLDDYFNVKKLSYNVLLEEYFITIV